MTLKLNQDIAIHGHSEEGNLCFFRLGSVVGAESTDSPLFSWVELENGRNILVALSIHEITEILDRAGAEYELEPVQD